MINYLESQIDKLIHRIDQMGYHAHKNNAERSHQGNYISGEAYDYDMFLPGYIACFDAKSTSKQGYSIVDKDIKQINYLKKCKKSGADAFFLIYFSKTKKLLKFDVDILIKILEKTKTIHEEHGVKWDIEQRLMSLKENEAIK